MLDKMQYWNNLLGVMHTFKQTDASAECEDRFNDL